MQLEKVRELAANPINLYKLHSKFRSNAKRYLQGPESRMTRVHEKKRTYQCEAIDKVRNPALKRLAEGGLFSTENYQKLSEDLTEDASYACH